MHIEELKDGDLGGGGGGESRSIVAFGCGDGASCGASDGKRALIGVGARVLFYPTLLYNVVRNRIEPAFHWWDEVDKFLLLGAVPFPADIPCFKQLGVCGVVTLNEPYETLVPASLYHAHGIENLVIPTRDYLFAPSFGDICQAVDFIHKNVSCGRTTYVHCKAGRGRSTTVVLCYLVQHRHMTPSVAYEYVRSSRPRVRLAASQWQAVQDYYHLRVKTGKFGCLDNPVIPRMPALVSSRNFVAFDDSSFVVISEADLIGYNGEANAGVRKAMLAELYRVQYVRQAALARLSSVWVRYYASKDVGTASKCGREACSLETDQLVRGNHFLLSGMVVKL